MPQGQEHSWLERVAHTMRFHHTKCTITHTHEGIYIYTHTHIHTSCIMLSYSRKIKQTLPTFQVYGPTRYRKCKIDIVIPRERGPSKEQEKKWYRERGNPNTSSKEKAKRKRKEKTTQEGLAP